jgi:DNA-binding GntR family transcriptional regulator
MPPLRAASSRSLTDEAYEAIKHRIITCMFKPGEYINEAYVSGIFGIGRTPVHQALGRLVLEDLVSVIPRKGVIVNPLSLEEILQIIEVRQINEAHCVRLAAERATGSDIAAMARILAKAKRATEARDIEKMMLLDREFHLAIARASRNAVLGEVLRKLHERSLRFWFVSLTAPGQHKIVQKQHAAVLAALRKADPDAAEAAMRNHIESFRRNVVSFV